MKTFAFAVVYHLIYLYYEARFIQDKNMNNRHVLRNIDGKKKPRFCYEFRFLFTADIFYFSVDSAMISAGTSKVPSSEASRIEAMVKYWYLMSSSKSIS